MQDNDYIKFAFADMHGNLKLILNEPIDNKYVYGFKTEEDIDETLSLIPDDFWSKWKSQYYTWYIDT